MRFSKQQIVNIKYLGGVLDGTIHKTYQQDYPKIKIYDSYKYILTEKTNELLTYTFDGIANKEDMIIGHNITENISMIYNYERRFYYYKHYNLDNYLDLSVKTPRTINFSYPKKEEDTQIEKLRMFSEFVLTFGLFILILSLFSI